MQFLVAETGAEKFTHSRLSGVEIFLERKVDNRYLFDVVKR